MPEIARLSNFGCQLINPHARVLTQSLDPGAVGFVRVSVRLRHLPILPPSSQAPTRPRSLNLTPKTFRGW